MTDKPARQFALREIIQADDVSNQEDLRRRLVRRGFRTTQATLSRDLREMGISRVAEGGRLKYALPGTSGATALRPIVSAEIRSIDSNEGLIVVHTLPGAAHTVGEFIDMQNHREIIGTVAGDNTLLVVPRSHKNIPKLLNYLKHKLIEGGE